MTGDPADIFRHESQELLEQLEQALLDLDRRPGDAALIDSAFRALHTIKGSGAMFGFDAVAGFTHHVENVFDGVRQGRIAPSPELIALALAARDHIRTLLERPDADVEAAGQAILSGLRGIVERAADGPAPVPRPAATAGWRIGIRLARDAMAMGTNPLLLLDELSGLGSAVVCARTDEVPPLDQLDPADCHLSWEVVLQTARSRAEIEAVFLFVIDDMQLTIEPLAAAAGAPGAVADAGAPGAVADAGAPGAVAGAAAPGAVADAGAPGAVAGAAAPGAVAGAAAPGDVALAAPVAETAMAPRAKAADPAEASARREAAGGLANIRVPAERLDELMERVGELVIAQSRLRQIAIASSDLALRSMAEDIERLVLELRDTTMGMRTIPIGNLFSRFRRLVHDIGRDLSKTVELVTSGEETELDKTVIERLNDPLVHLIRNALDHGLETPETRLRAGKPAGGTLLLSARHVGAQVRISIKDDGHGLDHERIRARAEQRGLITPQQKLTDAELFQLIFAPGFSTAAAVTSLSGRGVGMDVVKRAIEALRGSIDIASRPGEGTEVTLRLPLTLAIIDGLLVRVGQGRYVIPLSVVEQCVELTDEERRAERCNFLNIRDQLVPFLRLAEVFGAGGGGEPYPKVVIVGIGDQRVGLVVDQVIGDHQTVIKSLSPLHADVEMFSGATILGDGSVALILDVAHLIGTAEIQEQAMMAAE